MRVKEIRTKRLVLLIRQGECYLFLNRECIGNISFSSHNVGYALFKNEVKRNGYMTEAMEALMNYMRVCKHYSFAFAYARVENEASNKILRKFFGEPYFTTNTHGHKTHLYGAFFK